MPSTCMLPHSASQLPRGQQPQLGIRGAVRLNLTAPALRDAVPGRHVCWFQGDVDIMVWGQKQGHIREGVANADRLYIGCDRRPGAIGGQSQGVARQSAPRLVREVFPDGSMHATGIAAARWKKIDDQHMIPLTQRCYDLVEEIVDCMPTVFVTR